MSNKEEPHSRVLTVREILAETKSAQKRMAQLEQVAGERLDKCSYEQGAHEQDVYACRTCQDQGAAPAGFCLACSMNCHVNHEVYELHVKRDFTCDCGNDRFNGVMRCQLLPEREKENEGNKYSKNFQNLYCRCVKTPEEGGAAEMLMCYVCQDWYHDACMIPADLFSKWERERKLFLFICLECQKKHSCLRPYTLASSDPSTVPPASDPSSSASSSAPSAGSSSSSSDSSSVSSSSEPSGPIPNGTSSSRNGTAVAQATTDTAAAGSVLGKRKHPEEEETKAGSSSGDSNNSVSNGAACTRPPLPEGDSGPACDVIRFAEDFKTLCKCEACSKLFEEQGVGFLLREDPTRDDGKFAFLYPSSDDEEEEEEDGKAAAEGAAGGLVASITEQVALEIAQKAPPAVQLEVAERAMNFLNAFKQGLASQLLSLGEGDVFGTEHVQAIIQEASHRAKRADAENNNKRRKLE